MMPLIITRSRSSSSTLPRSEIKILSTIPVKRSPSVYVIVSVVVSEMFGLSVKLLKASAGAPPPAGLVTNVEFGLKRGRRQDVGRVDRHDQGSAGCDLAIRQ